MNDFQTFWRNGFKDILPLGYQLRQAYPQRWVRFHALPDAKRYPDNPNDNEIILHRANTLAEACLEGGHDCYIVIPRYAQVSTDELNDLSDESFETLFDIKLNEDDEVKVHFFVKVIKWEKGACDAILLKVANDEEQAIIVNQASGQIFAPYHGGFDLILNNSHQVARLKKQYPDWLSKREDGL